MMAGGLTSADNLALACVSCSLYKAARLTARDPDTGHEVALFAPRSDIWSQHFQWDGLWLKGLSAKGRATIETLRMNRPLIIAIREEEMLLGRHPPPRLSEVET